MATVSDFIVLTSGEFFLPGLITAKGETHIRGSEVFDFTLPGGVTGLGLLSFIVWTDEGEDGKIDLAFDVSGYSWEFSSSTYFGMQLPIGRLAAGDNYIDFNMSKGGKRSEPDPDESLGGAGRVKIGQVCLIYQRQQ